MSSFLPTGVESTYPIRDLYLGIQAVDVFVHDLEQSLQFYVNQLGFKLVSDVILQSGRRRVGVSPPDGTAALNLIAPEPDSDDYKLIGRPTQVVFVTEDVAAKYTEWRKRGIRFHHTPRLRRIKYLQQAPARVAEQTLLFGDQPPVWGGVFTRFEDLDHNSFALVSLDEVSRAIEAHRRDIAAKLESERRAAHELEIAKQVQARLFPQALPQVETLEYAGICIQAREVGGDYYDFLQLPDGRLGIAVGDVSGKGVGAALMMASLEASLRALALVVQDPADLMGRVNTLMCQASASNRYATLFYAEYDPSRRRLSYVNAGHNPPMVLRNSVGSCQVQRLEVGGSVIGLFPQKYQRGLFSHEPGDLIVLFTDGVSESMNVRDEEWGEERLIELAKTCHGLPALEGMSRILAAAQAFAAGAPQHDDMTLVVLRVA